MKQMLKLSFLVALASLLIACGFFSSTATDDTTPIISLTDVNGTAVSAASTLLAQTMTAVPTTEQNIITTANIDDLIQVKQLGMGALIAPPIYSPDGQWIYLPTKVGVFVLDTASYSYQHRRMLVPISGYISVMTLSPDGKILAVGSRMISTDDGRECDIQISTRIKDGNAIRGTEFSPDGKLFAVFYSGAVDVYRMSDGALLYTLSATAVHFSADGRLMVITNISDGFPRIELYEAQTGKLLQDWAGERAMFSTANQLAVENKGAIRIYDLSTGKVPYAFNGKYPVFSPDGKYIAFLYPDHIEIRSTINGKLLHKLDGVLGGDDDVTLHFAPDGQTIAISAYRGACCGGGMSRLSLWNVADGTLIKDERGGDFYFSPDGKTVDFGSQILNTSDGSVHATIDGLMSLGQYLAFIDDGRELVSFDGQKDHPFFIYQVDSGQSKWVQISNLGSIGFSIDQAGKFSVFSPYLFGYWTEDERFNELRPKVQERANYDMHSILFSPDSQILATGSRYNGILRIWDIQKQSLILEQSLCPKKMTSSLAFSPDGKQIASACTDYVFEENGEPTIYVWQIFPTQQRLLELSNYGYGYTIVAYSPDGRYIAGAGTHVQVWDAIDGRPVLGVNPQDTYGLDVRSITFSPNSDILAFGLKDGSVELWSVQDAKRLRVLSGAGYNPVHALAFSPDGKLLAVGLDNGSIQLWGIK